MFRLFRKKPDHQKVARDDDRALRKVYEYGSVTVALARIETYWSFNKSTPLEADIFIPLSHRHQPVKAHGVVDEYGHHDVRIMVDVDFTKFPEKSGIGHCYLEQKAGARTLHIVLNDPDGTIGIAMADAIRDGAISGSLFQHFRLTVQKNIDLGAVKRQIAEVGYGPSALIADIDTLRRVILPKAPTTVWRREYD